MIDLVHKRQQAADFAWREALTRKPVQIVTRQIRNQSAFIFSERHDASDQQFEVFWIHREG